MEEIAIPKFKADCTRILERVQRTGTPVRITRFGKPIAEVIASALENRTGWMGCMAGTGRIIGDIVSPASDESDWEAFGS